MSIIKDMLAESAGAPSYFTKDSPIGSTITGQIVATTVRQATDFVSGDKKFWDDGNPMQQIVITLQTGERNAADPDDDGQRSIYIKWWGGQRRALQDAVKAAGDDDVRVGGTFTATYTGDGEKPAQKGLSAPKLYSYTYQPPSATAGLMTQPEPVQAPAVAPAPAPVAAPAPAAPAPAPVATAAPVADPLAAMAQIQSLIKGGLTDEQIAAVVASAGISREAVVAVRASMAATV